MAKPRPLTNNEGEVRELMEEDFALFVSSSALSAELHWATLTRIFLRWTHGALHK